MISQMGWVAGFKHILFKPFLPLLAASHPSKPIFTFSLLVSWMLLLKQYVGESDRHRIRCLSTPIHCGGYQYASFQYALLES